MLLLGAIQYTEAKRLTSTDLVQVIEANGMTAVVDQSESDNEADHELVQVSRKGDASKKRNDSGIVDALTEPKGQCTERLWESADEMVW